MARVRGARAEALEAAAAVQAFMALGLVEHAKGEAVLVVFDRLCAMLYQF